MSVTKMLAALAAVAGVATVTFAGWEQAVAQQTDDQIAAVVRALHWQQGGAHKFAQSHSTLVLPTDHVMVEGGDAARFENINGNPNLQGLEAVTLNDDYEQVIFQSVEDGYVSSDDWKDIDADALMKAIKKNTDADNVERRKNGFPSLEVIGWLQQPTFDPVTKTAYWAFEAKSGINDKVVNARSVRLSRDGYELLTWVGAPENYKPIGGDLDIISRGYSFDAGHRYADHVSGDRIAAYTIGGLVAALVGAKAAKVALFGGLLFLLKKFGVLVLAGIGAILYRMKAFFRRKKPESAPARTE